MDTHQDNLCRTAWVLAEEYIGKDKCFNLYFEETRKRIEAFLEG